MPLYETVVNPATGEIDAPAWNRAADTGTVIGVCEDCGADLYGARAQRAYTQTYRDVHCMAGHERTVVGPRYLGTVLAAAIVEYREVSGQ